MENPKSRQRPCTGVAERSAGRRDTQHKVVHLSQQGSYERTDAAPTKSARRGLGDRVVTLSATRYVNHVEMLGRAVPGLEGIVDGQADCSAHQFGEHEAGSAGWCDAREAVAEHSTKGSGRIGERRFR
jgi:hypothetical protein